MNLINFGIRTGIVALVLTTGMWAEEETACNDTSVATVPSRPTVSNSTDTTQCGVLEVEYGWEQLHTDGIRQNDATGGLRIGLTHNLDFHWSSTEFFQVSQAGRDDRGFGDNWVGVKYRLSKQSEHVPSFGVMYMAKIPSAPTNLGSGHFDHAISLIASKDLHHVHFDFNVMPFWAGSTAGMNHNTGFTLSSSLPVNRKLSLVTEAYGYTCLDRDTPAYGSTMAGFTYQQTRRLVFDAGVDLGVTHDAPQRRLYAGVTYAIGNGFSWLQGRP